MVNLLSLVGDRQASFRVTASTIAASGRSTTCTSIRTRSASVTGVAPVPTIYERAGGQAAFERWLNAFYDLVERDELLAPLFGGTVTEEHRATSRPGGAR